MQLGLVTKTEPGALTQKLERHEADVVSGAGIFRTGISQTHHQLEISGHTNGKTQSLGGSSSTGFAASPDTSGSPMALLF